MTISLDFELAWAWQFARRTDESPGARGLREREQVPRILKLFDDYGIPATWATVGHLFLRECRRDADGRAHGQLPRVGHFQNPLWSFRHGDWYQNDPCTDVRRDPAWYAPDLVEAIQNARAGHEIACHGFSHLGFGSYCSVDVAEAEITACIEAARPFGLRPATWIFPGHEEGHPDVLSRNGFTAVRGFPGTRVHVTLPLRSQGLWWVNESSGIDRGKGWSAGQRLVWLQRLIDAAARTKLAAHVWLHPSLPHEQIHQVLSPFVRACAEAREKGVIEILTMGCLVDRMEQGFR